MIAHREKNFKTLNDPIYVGDRKIGEVYANGKRYYPDVYVTEDYAVWITFPAKRCSGTPELPTVDQMGDILYLSDDIKITKCAVVIYLNYQKMTSVNVATPSGGTWCDALVWGFRGENITSVLMTGYGALGGQAIYGREESTINKFYPKYVENGFYKIEPVNCNIFGERGEKIADFSTGVQSHNVKVFYSDSEFEEYLSTD